MASIKPIKVWGTGGPNPPKVAMLLEELGVPYEATAVPLSEVKKPEYTKVNPNGRIPAIHDPNTDLTLWESGAILDYLVEKYDTERKFSFPPGSNESFLVKQYLFYQASGQGPYYGQAAWFKKFHHEQLPSAIERYVKEINRINSVLESVLSQQKVAPGEDGPWLVGGKYSVADLAFISWQNIVAKFHSAEEFNQADYPLVKAWLERMNARPAIQKATGQTGQM